MKLPILKHRSWWRLGLIYGGGIIVLVLLLAASLTQGQVDISFLTVKDALLNPQDTLEHHLVLSMRLPRAIIAILVGAALAVAGALLQTVTRNPLASAGTFGINAGAFFVVVLAAVFFPVLKSSMPLILALSGGIGAAFCAYLLAGGKKGSPVRMALAGMIVTLVLSSFTSTLQLLYENETNGLFIWGSGSLIQNDWGSVSYAWLWIIATLLISFYFSRRLDLLELDEGTAKSLGQRVDATRMVALFSAVFLASVSVSVVGPIGFVGLIAPHLVRLIGMHRHRWLIPGSALWGANVLLCADIFARMFRSTIGELPAGVVTALIGAPWLIWLATRGAKGEQRVSSSTSMQVGMARSKIAYPLLIILSLLSIAIFFVLSLSLGGIRVPIAETLAVLAGQGEDLYRNIIMNLRIPRITVALLAGAGLGVAGAMLQGAVRNPLADPSIIGVTSGAGVGALLLIVMFPTLSYGLLPLAAILGAAISAAVVYFFAWRRGLHPTVLILIGIAVTAINSAIIHFLVIRSGMSAAPALAWLAGSTYARGWAEVYLLAPFLIILLPLAWWYGRKVDLLAFGDQTALGLGLKLRQTRLIAAFIGVALAAIVVAAVGTIGFVGLLAPHAARMLIGHNHRRLVVLSALLGANLLLVADILGRTAISPKEIPVGLVVALIGAPYIFMLMLRSRARA